jgi:hypothetical protein
MTPCSGGDIMSSMRRFVDQDAAYLDWLAEHPDGFVINTGRKPSAAYLMLHRANCGTISGTPARGSTFTGDYVKVCGSQEELDAYAHELAGVAKPCGLCLGQSSSVSDRGSRAEGKEVVFARGTVGQTSRGTRQTGGHPDNTPYIDAGVAASIAARARALGFDSAKLARLVDELNDNYRRGNAYAAHALLRAVLDHVPPMLGCTNFQAVANNHPWSRTDKNYARRLLDFKLQADDVLHRQISASTDLLGIEDMPPRVWVNRILQECAG